MNLKIAINCWNYQVRLSWMLSSILQQKGDIPNLFVDVSYTPNNGNPTTEEVLSFFKKQGLNILETVLTPKEVVNRGVARNKQLRDINEMDWYLFADCDMVYSSEFMVDLKKQMETSLANETRCMGADRVSLRIDHCVKYFESDQRQYPCVIENVADLVSTWPVMSVRGKGIAPGNFQLASSKAIKEKSNGIYTGTSRDYLRSTRSDRHFRIRMGRTGIDVKPQYHLNHSRSEAIIQR